MPLPVRAAANNSVNTELETRGEWWNYPPENVTKIGPLPRPTSAVFSRAFVSVIAQTASNTSRPTYQ